MASVPISISSPSRAQYRHAKVSSPSSPTGMVQPLPSLTASDLVPDTLKPFVSLVTPAYNEAAILEENLSLLCEYMQGLEAEFDWEIVVINDGSRDDTGLLADEFAARHSHVRVIHHLHNCGLGQALRTGFHYAQGDYIVTLDLDLSYSPDHIERLVRRMIQTGSQVVVASPYMKGGRVSNVPGFRLFLSVWANRFLSLMAKRDVATLTGMVRAYDARFLAGLHPRSMGMDINPEIIHKAKLLNERIDEIPAHLHWRSPAAPKPAAPKRPQRKSSMKILRHTWSIFFYGFLFRPVLFFLIPSLLCFGLAMYAGSWSIIHSWNNYHQMLQTAGVADPTDAVSQAFQQAPHTFVIGGMLMMLSVQLFSLAVLSVQSKHYFEEIFHLGTSIYRSTRQNPEAEDE